MQHTQTITDARTVYDIKQTTKYYKILSFFRKFSELRRKIGALRLSAGLNRPYELEKKRCTFDDLTRGLITEPMSESDQYYDKEVTEFLFR